MEDESRSTLKRCYADMGTESEQSVLVGKDELEGWLKELAAIQDDARWLSVRVNILYERIYYGIHKREGDKDGVQHSQTDEGATGGGGSGHAPRA